MARESKRVREEKRFGKADRLADKIVCTEAKAWQVAVYVDQRSFVSHGEMHENCINGARKSILGMPAFEVSNASNLYWESEKDVWLQDDFPNLAPPHAQFFMEADAPLKVGSFDNEGRIPHQGVFFAYMQRSDGGWKVVAMPVAARASGPCYMAAMGVYSVDESGRLQGWPYWQCENAVNDFDMTKVAEAFTQMLKPFWFATSLLHCKNVVTQVNNPDARLNRERQRHGLKPFLRYHTINIEPMKRVLRTEGQIESNGLKRALHICRGHFSHYSEDKPLFGKVAGTFWIPSHVRGSVKEGVVVSDYKVSAK